MPKVFDACFKRESVNKRKNNSEKTRKNAKNTKKKKKSEKKIKYLFKRCVVDFYHLNDFASGFIVDQVVLFLVFIIEFIAELALEHKVVGLGGFKKRMGERITCKSSVNSRVILKKNFEIYKNIFIIIL